MRFKVLAGLVVSGLLVAGLTGCSSVSKDKYNAAMQENTDLHAKVADLEAKNQENNLRLAEASKMQNQQPTGPGTTIIDPMGPSDSGNGGNGGHKKITKNNGGGEVFEIAGDVGFNSGSATLTPAAKKELDTFAKKIKSTYSGRSIRVEGYTDSTPIKKAKGKFSSNEALSQARAEAVRSYLVSKGISSSRIEAIGYGAAKPKKTPAASRRVDVVVLAD